MLVLGYPRFQHAVGEVHASAGIRGDEFVVRNTDHGASALRG